MRLARQRVLVRRRVLVRHWAPLRHRENGARAGEAKAPLLQRVQVLRQARRVQRRPAQRLADAALVLHLLLHGPKSRS